MEVELTSSRSAVAATPKAVAIKDKIESGELVAADEYAELPKSTKRRIQRKVSKVKKYWLDSGARNDKDVAYIAKRLYETDSTFRTAVDGNVASREHTEDTTSMANLEQTIRNFLSDAGQISSGDMHTQKTFLLQLIAASMSNRAAGRIFGIARKGAIARVKRKLMIKSRRGRTRHARRLRYDGPASQFT